MKGCELQELSNEAVQQIAKKPAPDDLCVEWLDCVLNYHDIFQTAKLKK